MGKLVMVVDDSRAVREALTIVLKGQGFDVVQAVDGEQALEQLDGRKISLIISDLNMPKIDGMTFVKTLKSDDKYAEYRFTPVIMLTSESGYEQKKEGKVAGVKVWVTKPVEPNKLVNAISMLLV